MCAYLLQESLYVTYPKSAHSICVEYLSVLLGLPQIGDITFSVYDASDAGIATRPGGAVEVLLCLLPRRVHRCVELSVVPEPPRDADSVTERGHHSWGT